jgi:3D (Asp-Asp-Asp) domain-containing protein
VRARRSTLRTAWIVLCAGALAATVLPATGAGSPPGAGDLRAKESALAQRARTALLELYSLDAQLTQANARAASLDRSLAAVRSRRDAVDQQLRVARASLRASRLAQGRALRQIYEAGPSVDPIAVILGAQSLDDAMTQLENLRQLTLQQRSIVLRVSARRAQLRQLAARLAVESATLSQLDRQAHAAASRLVQARSARASYIDGLRRQQSLTRRQLARVEQASARAAARAQAVTRAAARAAAQPSSAGSSNASATTTSAPAQPEEAAPAPSGPPPKGSTMVVLATAYDLPGTTASGLPVGIGIVATDPTVIPLGTRFFVPGYGPAVAADTGSAVKGAHIDVWLPPERIGSWSTHTLTITFL